MEDSVFTMIIKGELPSYKIFEDDKTLAFLDIRPQQPGQTVVVPKTQVPFVWDLDEDDYIALMRSVQRVGQKLREVFSDKKRVGVMIEGLDVGNHAHVVVLPFDTPEEYHGYAKEADQKKLAELAERLRIN